MFSKIKALYFTLLLISKKQFKSQFEPVPITFLYEYSLKRIVSTNEEILLVFHSINGVGNQDPRIQRLGAIASQVGFNVYLPNLPDSASRVIMKDAVERMSYFLQECYHYFQKPFSIIVPSYIGTLCLEVLSYPNIKPMVKSICCIGSSHSINRLIEDTLNNESVHEHNLLVLLKSMLVETDQLTSNLSTILTSMFTMLNSHQNLSKFDFRNNELTITDKYWIKNALNQRIIQEAFVSYGLADKLYTSLHNRLHLISTPVSIIHGISDETIPVSSALELDRGLTGCPHKMVITTLLKHVELHINLSTIKDIFMLLNIITFFLENAFRRLD